MGRSSKQSMSSLGSRKGVKRHPPVNKSFKSTQLSSKHEQDLKRTGKSVKETRSLKESSRRNPSRSSESDRKSTRSSRVLLSLKRSESSMSLTALTDSGYIQPVSQPPPGIPQWSKQSDTHALIKREYGPVKIEMPTIEEVRVRNDEDKHQVLISSLRWQTSLLNYYRSHIIMRFLLPLQREISRGSKRDVDLKERLEFTRRGFPIVKPQQTSSDALVERLSKMAAGWRLFYLINIQESLLVWEKNLVRFLSKTEIRAKWRVIQKFEIEEQLQKMTRITISLAEIWDLPIPGVSQVPASHPSANLAPTRIAKPGTAPTGNPTVSRPSEERKAGGSDREEEPFERTEPPIPVEKSEAHLEAERVRDTLELGRIRDTESRIRYFQMAMSGLLREFRGVMMKFDTKFSFTRGYELPATPKQIMKKILSMPPQYRLAELMTIGDKTKQLLLRYDLPPPGVFGSSNPSR